MADSLEVIVAGDTPDSNNSVIQNKTCPDLKGGPLDKGSIEDTQFVKSL